MKPTQEFSELWAHAEPVLVRSLQRRGTPPDLVNDVVQEVALLALLQAKKQGSYERFVSQFDSPAKFVSWGKLRAFWLLVDRIRGDRRLIGLTATQDEASIEPNQEGRAYVCQIKKLILQLPKRQQEAITGLAAGASSGEIASHMDVSEATVRSLQRFARARLVSMLTENSSDIRKE